ncbi:DUF397 domain-containing protein [Actinoalloteichus spitiensis]|uniref:DUF397 domain-containing protein n=1 Tax=Actinoalloteichus spitiensis TaxID=252394 RepID=UPI00068DEC1F|nr:DUF397 domain-containing protein [Actinoalloteichus spitiensis]
MNQAGAAGPRWRSSSHSDGDCVEVLFGDGVIGVRDSKRPREPVLLVTRMAWRRFLRGLRRDEFVPREVPEELREWPGAARR